MMLPRFEGLPWLASSAWAYPALEVVHIVGIALLLGSLVVVELRVWGAAPALPLAALARLGLSVSRSIIESQNGELWATPNPDRGMSFHFTLPVCGHPPGFSQP